MSKAQLEQVKEIVEQLTLPEFVQDIEYELDVDHMGNPCVRIRVIIADDAMPKANTSRDLLVQAYRPLLQVKSAISDSIYRNEIELWPYVNVVSESQRATIANLA